MGRPTKQIVDYFPHNCKHGRTVFILEQRYGIKGYAFWFKLLEELGSTDGHNLNLNDENTLEFLSAKTQFLPAETLEVLNLLAKLNAIDSKLWKKKIIWSQNFIDNLSHVYSKRIVSVPDKPLTTPEKQVKEDIKTQSKVKESKVKESKVKESKVKESRERVTTPSQVMQEFLSSKENQEEIVKRISEKYNADYNFILGEVNKFISYWTEPNKSGTKVRWELQPTFDLMRRLAIWFGNIKTQQGSKYNIGVV